MENSENKKPVEFEGVTSKTYGLNVELPKNMSEYGYDDYMFHLNRGLTQEERQQYIDTNIPYDVGLGIAARSKNKPDKKETKLTSVVTDTLKGAYNLMFELPASFGENIDDTITGIVNDLLYDNPEQARQATLKNAQLRRELKQDFLLETEGTIGEDLSSVAGSTAIGVITKANPLVLTMFGSMNYQENLQKMLEGGASFKEASSRAFFGGLLEVASEKFGFQVASKYTKGLLRKYAARFGIESFQEFWQEIKDQFILGKYDTRSEEQQAKDAAKSALLGGLGGAVGFGIADVSTRKARKNIQKIAESQQYEKEEAKEIGLSILDEKGKEYRQDVQKKRNERINEALNKTRGEVYDRLVEQGNDPVIAAEKAETLVPSFETMENDIEEIISRGFEQSELDKLKQDYDEAIRIGGDKAVVYMQLKDKVSNLAKEAGYTDEESEGQQKILTSLFAKWYDESNMSVDDFWNFLETRMEIKDYIDTPIVGEGMITQEQIEDEIKNREQLETAMNVGKKAGKMFSWIGQRANLTKRQKTSLDEAESLERDGLLNNEQIRQTTGWERGDEGKWRLEISDRDSKINAENIREAGLKLGDILSHDKLYGAYPFLKKVQIRYVPNLDTSARVSTVNGKNGRYDIIQFGKKFENSDEQEQRETVMHEVMHVIQDFEGFARGGSKKEFRSPKMSLTDKVKWNTRIRYADMILGMGNWKSYDEAREKIKKLENTDDELLQAKIKEFQKADEYLKEYDKNTAYQKYMRLGGENEARNVEKRIDLTDEERRKISPEETRDIPKEDIIIKFNKGLVDAYKDAQELEDLNTFAERQMESDDTLYSRTGNQTAFTGDTIDINGVEKTVYNSDGAKIAQTEQSLRNFYNWFGDSKVVDEQGRPLVVYHGSDANFDVFDRTKTRSTMDIQGNFFSPWELDASGYGANVRPFYLKITNPASSVIGYKTLKKYQGQNDAGIKAREELEKMGYDGVNNDDEEYIAFNPNQIKSVENTGAYDPNNPDIYYSRTDRIQGAFDRVNNIIEIAKEHNPDVFLHEMSHLFFTNYMPWLQESGNSKKAESIYKLVGKDNVYDFTGDDWEKITEVFLQYVKTGDAPNLAMKSVFAKAKDWLITQYRTISEDYEVSDEVKDFFDTLIADESDISELADVKTRIRDVENSIKQYLDNQQITFRGKSAEDIKALKKAYHTRVPAQKGKSLTQHLKKVGGIEPNSGLAKQLSYDPKKKNPIFKKGGIDSMDDLIDFLYTEGYMSNIDYDTYEQRSAIEDEVENLIDNSDNVFNEENAALNENRENALALQNEVAKIYDDIMVDLGLKSYDELESVLANVAKDITVQNKNISKLNKSAVEYIKRTMKKARKDIKKTEKDMAVLKEKYADKLQKAKEKAERDNQKLKEQQKERIQSLKERNEASKERLIEKQKDKIKEMKQMQKIIDDNQFVLQQELTNKIRGLPISHAHQNQLLKNVAKVKDLNSYNRIVEDVMQRADKFADQEMKVLLINGIKSMLKSTEQKNGENKKNTYEGYKLFAELRAIQKMTQSEAQNMLDDRIEQSYRVDENGVDESIKLTEADKMINRMLQFRADGMKASSDVLYELALDINDIITKDIKTREMFEEVKREKRQDLRDRMVRSLESLKKGSLPERVFSQYLGDWHTINNEAFGKSIADELNILYETSNQEEYYSSRKNYEEESAKIAYGLTNGYQWLDKYEELKKPKYTIERNDTKVPVKLSTAALMDMYLQMRNPETRKLIIRDYEIVDEDGVILTQNINRALQNLTEQDKTMALMLAQQLEKDYDVENKAYIKRTGVDMPRVEGYFPRTSDYNGDIDTDYRNVALARPSFYKMRSSNAHPVFKDAIQKYREHIMEASYAVEMFDRYKEIYLTVMNSADLKEAYSQKYGEKGWTEYRDYLFTLAPKKYINVVSRVDNLAEKLVNNWIAKNIGYNVQVYAKQLISIINYSENMPVGEYYKNLAYGIAHPKEVKDFMEKMAGDFIRNRYEKGLQNETLASVLNTDNGKTVLPLSVDARMKDISSYFVRKGDITPIIFGGYAHLKYLKEQGYSDEEMKKIFITETKRSQQDSSSPSLSIMQKSKNWATRMILAYKNTALQYTRLTMEAVTQFRRGEISEKQFAKTIFTYQVAGRIIYEISSGLLKGLSGLVLGDDKKKEEATPSIAQMATFPLRFYTDAIPLLDTAVNAIVQKSAGGKVYSSGLGLSDDIQRAWVKFTKKGSDFNDMVDGTAVLFDVLTGWGVSTLKREIGYFVPEKKNKF